MSEELGDRRVGGFILVIPYHHTIPSHLKPTQALLVAATDLALENLLAGISESARTYYFHTGLLG